MNYFKCSRDECDFVGETSDILKKHEKDLLPEQIMFSFQFIMEHKLEKNPDFWNFLVPLVKKQMTTLDRQTVRSLYDAISGAS